MNTKYKLTPLVGLLCCNFSVFADDAANNIHIIKKGETLHSLAKRYKMSVAQLKALNGITDVNKINPGQTLVLSKDVSLKQKAEAALTAENYSLAIRLLMALREKGNEAEQAFALEFLGVAREKKGQKAFAKQAYSAYINSYPDSPDIERVKLRLNNLIGIETLTQNRTLKKTSRDTTAKTSRSDRRKNRRKPDYNRGSISFDYRRGQLTNNLGESRNTLSMLNADINAKGHFQMSDYSIDYRISMGRYQDLLPNSDKTNDRIRYLNASAQSDDNSWKVSFGRQRSRNKGIFGRFDGIVVSHEMFTDTSFNVYAGYPVASSKATGLDPERRFYGVSMDIKDSWQDIDFSVFLFNQTINNLTDRRAVGATAKYFKNNVSHYGLVDYDIFFNTLNALLYSGSYATQDQKRFNWSYNYRKSPYVGTRNALIGQAVDSMAELQNQIISDEDILDLAVDRSLTSKTLTLGYYQPLSEKYDISTNLTWMDLSGAPGSGGVAEIAETGAQYYANISFGAKKLYSERDNNRFGIRYSSLATSTVVSLFMQSQYRFENGFSLTPKLRFDSRSNDNGTSQQNISPTLRMQYQSKNHYLYADLGAILYNSKSDLLPDQKTNVYFLYLGYRYYF